MVNFLPNDTLAGYARTAVDLRIQMADYHASNLAPHHVSAFLETLDPTTTPTPAVVDAMAQITGTPWRVGEVYVLAPAMTAIVGAATQALDLTGEVLPDDIAPTDHGVLLLPEPLYQRGANGRVASIGAITWARTTALDSGQSCWVIAGWADAHDPHDPSGQVRRELIASRPDLSIRFGPYILTDFAEIPIGTPIPARPDLPTSEDGQDEGRDWQPAPDGRFCLDDATNATRIGAAIAYAFWRIQAQPLATIATAPLGRATRRRAMRASLHHDTRVVMLRRTSTAADDGVDGQARWHYRVRFVVRGHWRRLVDRDGVSYRIWIHAHIKGPDDAPLLHGEKVAVLAR